jgi:hypothetical protein
VWVVACRRPALLSLSASPDGSYHRVMNCLCPPRRSGGAGATKSGPPGGAATAELATSKKTRGRHQSGHHSRHDPGLFVPPWDSFLQTWPRLVRGFSFHGHLVSQLSDRTYGHRQQRENGVRSLLVQCRCERARGRAVAYSPLRQVHPNKRSPRPSALAAEMGQVRTHAPQQTARWFDHQIGGKSRRGPFPLHPWPG